MVCLVSELRSRTDYILGMDRRFQEFRLPGPSAQLGPLHGPGLPAERPLTEHKRYLGGRKRWLVRPPRKPTRKDQLFAAL